VTTPGLAVPAALCGAYVAIVVLAATVYHRRWASDGGNGSRTRGSRSTQGSSSTNPSTSGFAGDGDLTYATALGPAGSASGGFGRVASAATGTVTSHQDQDQESTRTSGSRYDFEQETGSRYPQYGTNASSLKAPSLV
jgi:hypothetical protein